MDPESMGMATEQNMKLLGVHITKCAGTSLIGAIRRRLTEEKYHFCSSYYENQLASRPRFAEITTVDLLSICFGHYVNENYLGVIGGNSFLFTGLRDPVSRLVSNFGQENWNRFLAGQFPISAADYANLSPPTICLELCRAFPTAIGAAHQERWRDALKILSLFDYVYMTESFENDIKVVFNYLDIKEVELEVANIRTARKYPDDLKAYIGAETTILASCAHELCYDDLVLFDSLRKFLNCSDLLPSFRPVDVLRESKYFIPRVTLLDTLPVREICLKNIADLEVRYMVNEFDALNKIELLETQSLNQIRCASAVTSAISEITGGSFNRARSI